MRMMSKWLLPAAVLIAASTAPAAAQPFGYGYDDSPPPFRRGPGWDGPPRWDRYHQNRRWRDEGGYGRRGWRDGDRDGGPRRFGDDNRRRFGNDDDDGGNRGGRRQVPGGRESVTGRGDGGDVLPRRGGGGGPPRPLGGGNSD